MLWALLLILRYRVLQRRIRNLVVELVCLFIAIVSLICAVFAIDESSPERRLPFTMLVDKQLRKGPLEWSGNLILNLHRYWRRDVCERLLSLNKPEIRLVQNRLRWLELAHQARPLHVISIMVCVMSVICSIFSIVTVVRVAIRSSQKSKEKASFVEPSTLSSLPSAPRSLRSSYNDEFFSHFLEVVPSPLGSIVLNAVPHCSICLEAMLEDTVRLPACKHSFHRRCILRCLVHASNLKCPRCGRPMKKVKPDNEDLSN